MKSHLTDSISLLTNGKEAFPEILKCIENAKESIEINMFIWRADNIGKTIAKAVFNAAERGVKVYISVDRYGFVLEKCEECSHSFFHKKPTFSESVKINTLKFLYPTLLNRNPPEENHGLLLEKILNHPNIVISKDVFKADHSKYYIIDEKILIMGGINIEDKENGCDIRGIEYQDYMIKFDGKEHVENFRNKMNNNINSSNEYRFAVNNKSVLPHIFEIEDHFLEIINSSQIELVIVMAYFSPVKKFTEAIISAKNRGVKVSIMIPEHANFQDDLNKKTVKKLMKATNNGINVFLSPKMAHTKLIFNEKTVSLGSANITKKAFNQLSELNFTIERTDSQFCNNLNEKAWGYINESRKISNYKEIKYNRIYAFVEGFVV